MFRSDALGWFRFETPWAEMELGGVLGIGLQLPDLVQVTKRMGDEQGQAFLAGDLASYMIDDAGAEVILAIANKSDRAIAICGKLLSCLGE